MPSRRVYWDSCCFLGLLNKEAGREMYCLTVWNEARRNQTIIYTSFLTFTEVFKVKCEGPAKPLAVEEDKKIEDFLRQKNVRPMIVDERIATAARRLMRHYPECKKPSDAIHLATALALNVDEMHTYDGADLLKLTGKVNRENGTPLLICRPRATPQPPLLAPAEEKK